MQFPSFVGIMVKLFSEVVAGPDSWLVVVGIGVGFIVGVVVEVAVRVVVLDS